MLIGTEGNPLEGFTVFQCFKNDAESYQKKIRQGQDWELDDQSEGKPLLGPNFIQPNVLSAL